MAVRTQGRRSPEFPGTGTTRRRNGAVRGTVVAAVLLTLPLGPAVLPAAGATTPGTEHDADLGSARERLDSTSRELADLRAAVRRTGDELAAIDERVRGATTTLVQLDTERVLAEAAHAAAGADERRAAGHLAEVDTTLDGALQEWASHRDLLAARAVHAFKHGPGAGSDLLVRGVGGAADWHEVAVNLEVLGRLSADERALVDSTVTTTRTTAALRADAGNARTAAVTTARRAAEEARRVAELTAQQAAVVAELEVQRTARAAVLAGFEADAAARAVLVQDLEEQVARLELSAARVLVPIQVDLDVYGPAPAWARGLPGAGGQWGAAVEAIAARHGIDGRLLAALVWTESGFRPDAVSHAGALGLAQLMPGTARGLGVDPRDPLQNLDGGARYLRTQLDRFGRVDLALAAYNAGPGRVQAAGAVPNIVETQLYVVKVLERYEKLRGGA